MNSGLETHPLSHPGGPVHGPHAETLALGAPEAVRLGLFWNWPERPGVPPGTLDATGEEQRALIDRWKITSRDSWLQVTDSAIRGLRVKSEPGEVALDVRDEVLETSGAAYLGLEDWLPAIGAHGERNGWNEEQTDLMLRSAVKVYHAEQALAEVGLLPPGQRVVTMFAYDLAHATYLTQAGMRVGYSDPHTAQQMLAALAHNAGSVFDSWASFGASYVLGCSVIEGGYPTDDVYRRAAEAVRTLLSSPQSPWTNIPLPRAA